MGNLWILRKEEKNMKSLQLRKNWDYTKQIFLIKQDVKGICRNELSYNEKNSRRKMNQQ